MSRVSAVSILVTLDRVTLPGVCRSTSTGKGTIDCGKAYATKVLRASGISYAEYVHASTGVLCAAAKSLPAGLCVVPTHTP
jgi:hypothetical protein